MGMFMQSVIRFRKTIKVEHMNRRNYWSFNGTGF
jgi:hypothetical protein